MEWEKGTCLRLIDEYEKYEELWNPKSGFYYNKSRKKECWSLIGKTLGCSAEEVRKKMESLLASYRREKAKGTNTIGTGKAAHEVHVSKWFAFSKMKFLKDRDKDRSTLNTSAVGDESASTQQRAATDIKDPQCQRVSDDECPVQATPTTLTQMPSALSSSSSSLRMPKHKRKRPGPEDDTRMNEILSTLKDAIHTNSPAQDECGIFGLYIASKLRNYDLRTRAIVQHEITSSLFNADMKLFHHSPITTKSLTTPKPQNAFDHSSLASSPSPQN